MGDRVFDQTVYIAVDDTLTTTSSDYHSLLISGDTMLIATLRTPSSSTATGNPGEMCIGKTTLLGVDTYWLYYCFATNHWVRTAFGGF